MGTNFTLACPYTLLAHYTELKWAASYGVESELVRISVGLEPVSTLKDVLASALNAAHHADDDGGNLEVVERLKREHFDVAVVDFFFGECGHALAHHALGLPVVGYW